MRKMIVGAALLLLGCGETKERLDGVDTTLPNGTVALASQDLMLSDNTMVTDMNATDGMDTMTDNMMAVDGAMSTDSMMPGYEMPTYPTYSDRDAEAARLEAQADRLEAQADSMSSASQTIPTDPFANSGD